MFLCVALTSPAEPGERAEIVVAADGSGDVTTIQAALDRVQQGNTQPVVIFIRKGTYVEKVLITESHIALVGEDRDSTRIVFAELRENWNKQHAGSDWGSGVVNIDTGVTNVTIANLTVYNNHGSLYGTHRKHQFAIRGAGTRIMLLHCNIISDGGDALSLWNKDNGMYYHNGCYFEGWVDYVCPRGWCYITDSRFFGHNMSASIWHDGDRDKRQKFVIANSFFDGVSGFPLGRNHRDGQFFLIDCTFSANMADRPIYHPPTSVTQWKWGARHYYFNCRRLGGNYDWFKDNLEQAERPPRPEEITAAWAFDGMWDPEGTMPSVLPFAFLPSPRDGVTDVPVRGVALAWVPGRNSRTHNVYFGTSNPPLLMSQQEVPRYEPGTLSSGTTYYWRVDEVTTEGVVEGTVWSFKTDK